MMQNSKTLLDWLASRKAWAFQLQRKVLFSLIRRRMETSYLIRWTYNTVIKSTDYFMYFAGNAKRHLLKIEAPSK